MKYRGRENGSILRLQKIQFFPFFFCEILEPKFNFLFNFLPRETLEDKTALTDVGRKDTYTSNIDINKLEFFELSAYGNH